MSRHQPLNRAIDAINHYRERTTHMSLGPTPSAFQSIRDTFQHAMDNNIQVLVENSEMSNMDSVRITLDYVGERWCRGYEEKRHFGEVIQVPCTIQYSEVYVNSQELDKTKVRTRIFFKGDNPYG